MHDDVDLLRSSDRQNVEHEVISAAVRDRDRRPPPVAKRRRLLQISEQHLR